MIYIMYCLRPKEIKRCNGSDCPYEHVWEEKEEAVKKEVKDE